MARRLPSGPTAEEKAAVQRKLREAVDLLQPVRLTLEEKGYAPTLEANEDDDKITLSLLIHTKWPSTSQPKDS